MRIPCQSMDHGLPLQFSLPTVCCFNLLLKFIYNDINLPYKSRQAQCVLWCLHMSLLAPPPPPPPPPHMIESSLLTACTYLFPDFTGFPVPKLGELCELAASFPHLWRQVGIGLGVDDGRLNGIQANNAHAPKHCQECFTDVFISWRDGITSPYTWEILVTVLLREDMVIDTRYAVNKLYDTLSHQYPSQQ